MQIYHLYEGPAKGLYEPTRFDTFMRTMMSILAAEPGRETRVNPERISEKATMYHMPELEVGVRHAVRGLAVEVSLLGTKKLFIEKVRLILLEEASLKV